MFFLVLPGAVIFVVVLIVCGDDGVELALSNNENSNLPNVPLPPPFSFVQLPLPLRVVFLPLPGKQRFEKMT